MFRTEVVISLDEKDFRCLVRGGTLKVRKGRNIFKIGLQDIGFVAMEQAIADVQSGKEKVYEGLEK